MMHIFYQSILILINLFVLSSIILLIRYILGLFTKVNSFSELTEKDNPAFGFSVASICLGISIVTIGIVHNYNETNGLLREICEIFSYSSIGLILIFISKFIFNRIIVKQTSVKEDIQNNNMATAIIDGANILTTSILIKSSIEWLGNAQAMQQLSYYTQLGQFFLFYLIASILFVGMAYYVFFALKIWYGLSFKTVVSTHNIAASCCIMAHLLTIALSINAAYLFLSLYNLESTILIIFLLSISAFTISKINFIISYFLLALMFKKVSLYDEIVKQNNIAIASIQSSIMLSISMFSLILSY